MRQSEINERVRKLSLDELELVIGGATTGGGGDTISVTCGDKACRCTFSIPAGRSYGICPECGATVYVNNAETTGNRNGTVSAVTKRGV